MNVLHGKDAFASANEPVSPSVTKGGKADQSTPRKSRFWIWLLVLAVVGGGGYVWFTRSSEAPAAVAVEQGPSEPVIMRLDPVEIVEVALSTQLETVNITGTLRPARQASVSTRSAGMIESVNVRPGDRVDQGDVIAELDTAELVLQRQQQEAAIAATRAQLTLAQSQLETARALAERGSSSRSALETAQSGVDSLEGNLSAQEAQLATLDLNLSNATIRAPFAGIIAERTVDSGQSVNPGTPVVVIVDTAQMEVVGNASLSDALDIEAGQNVVITVESLRNRTFAGRVGRISPVAEQGTRSLSVFLTLDNPGGMLRGGMFVTGQIVISQAEDVIAIPRQALLEDDEGKYVLVIEDDQLVRRAVAVVREWADSRMTEITGLDVGDVLVGQQLSGLASGMPVTIEGR